MADNIIEFPTNSASRLSSKKEDGADKIIYNKLRILQLAKSSLIPPTGQAEILNYPGAIVVAFDEPFSKGAMGLFGSVVDPQASDLRLSGIVIEGSGVPTPEAQLAREEATKLGISELGVILPEYHPYIAHLAKVAPMDAVEAYFATQASMYVRRIGVIDERIAQALVEPLARAYDFEQDEISLWLSYLYVHPQEVDDVTVVRYREIVTKLNQTRNFFMHRKLQQERNKIKSTGPLVAVVSTRSSDIFSPSYRGTLPHNYRESQIQQFFNELYSSDVERF